LVDDYRNHLRARRADPNVSVQHLFDEITAMGYKGGLNLLYKYINQGCLDGDRIKLIELEPVPLEKSSLHVRRCIGIR
jgi:hypothetical protein